MMRYALGACFAACCTLAVAALSLYCQTHTHASRQSRGTGYRMQHVTVQDVLSLIRPNPDTVRIINFWATTCRPCVEELPYFERIYRAYAIPVGQAKPVQVVLVSLDFARDVQAKVIPFVQKHGLTAKVVFWGTPKSEEIEAVDTQWTGAIPATIIVGTREGQRQFLEKKLSFEELENLVKMYIFP